MQFTVPEDYPTHSFHCKYLGTGAVCGYSLSILLNLNFKSFLSEQDDACIMTTKKQPTSL